MYDVAVIGAGPGGYVAAIRAAQRGAKAAVFEREALGGVCLNWGCIPSKTFLHGAHAYRRVLGGHIHGLNAPGCEWDQSEVIRWKNEVVGRNQRGIAQLFRGHGIEIVEHEARLAGPDAIQANGDIYRARSIILATGSRPRTLPFLDVDGERVVTSRAALDFETVPQRIAIIGGGAIGCEFASYWNALGSEVTILERLDRILPLEDPEVSATVAEAFEKRGMTLITGADIEGADRSANGVALHLTAPSQQQVDAGVVLLAAGVTPNSDVAISGSGAAPALDDRGFIQVDDTMATSLDGVYAIGDVTGTTLLAHGASAEGIVAAEKATGGHRTMRWGGVPSVTFTDPEVARIGLSKAQAEQAGYTVREGRFSYAASGRAAALDEMVGVIKIVAEESTDQVLGVHIAGAEAGELIAAAAVAMNMEATTEDLANAVYAHPSLSEMLGEAAEDCHALSIHTPPRQRTS